MKIAVVVEHRASSWLQLLCFCFVRAYRDPRRCKVPAQVSSVALCSGERAVPCGNTNKCGGIIHTYTHTHG